MSYQETRYGEFAEDERNVAGQIVLHDDELAALHREMNRFRREAKLMTSTITGIVIAATYGIKVNNFSTQTRIVALASGRRVFLVYCHVGSIFHRLLDGLMKLLAGLRMMKCSRGRWQQRFENRSQIPTFAIEGHRHMVAMPFVENVNAYDIMMWNRELRGLPPGFDWVRSLTPEHKLGMAQATIVELERYHQARLLWGEVILPNIIVDRMARIIVCDPEVDYLPSVSPLEARARDLRDLIISNAAALKQAENVPYSTSVPSLINVYRDPAVLDELHVLASQPRTLVQKLVTGYEMARTGAKSGRDYDEILATIASS